MPIQTPNPESSTTRPESSQTMPDQEGVSLVDGREPLAYSFRFTDHALGTPECEQDILRLPNDDAAAARNAFGSIYPGNPHTDDLRPAEIYDVVMFARKYEMIPEFKKVAPNWFRPRYCSSRFHPVHMFFGLEDCWHLMIAAYYMFLSDPDKLPDLRFAFSKLSERLVRDENPYYNARLREPVPDGHGIEVDIYCSIREARRDYGRAMDQHSQFRCMGGAAPCAEPIFRWGYGSFYLCRS
uniref:BTB domain-containing protein n=1 Tax=Fusarium oxysporum (strain Fo5176) TaxID=660025 RepID=A0A0D2Y5P7_FUSOF